jgi:hypothetical protein
MHAIKGKFKDGQVILTEKADWPDDTEVIVEPVAAEAMIGMREVDWSNTPEAIIDWLRWYDTLEPFLSPEDEAEWIAALQAQKEFDKATFEERARRLERLFE